MGNLSEVDVFGA